MMWANDNATLFYTTKDALDRPNKLWRSAIGDASEDELVFHEVHIPKSDRDECKFRLYITPRMIYGQKDGSGLA